MLDPRVAPGVHRIDAGRRAQVVAEREIGSGKADRAAAAVAMLHPSLDLPGAAEPLDGLARPAFAQVRTNAGGRSEEHTSELQSLMRNPYAVLFSHKTTKSPQKHSSTY